MKYDKKTDDMPVKSGNKGFYIALAVCLVAVCGVAVSTFVGSLSTSTPEEPTTTTVPTTAAPVDNLVEDVVDERPTTTTWMTTTTTATTTTATTTTTMSTTTTTAADLFVFPASNLVLTPYSDQPIYSETLSEWSTHDGVDFEAKQGQTVKAAADGSVLCIYHDALWGDIIEIQHGGNVLSRYCGVKSKDIAEGQVVKAGTVIGTVTEIPAEIVMKSHIHVEVLANDKYVDPLLLIRGETVTASTGTAVATTK